MNLVSSKSIRNSTRLSCVIFALMGQVSICSAQALGAPGAATPEDVRRASYALGLQQGASLRREIGSGTALDSGQVAAGMRDLLNGAKPAYTNEELSRALRAVFGRLAADARELSARNREARHFLARNRVAPGIVELKNGLQYRVVKEGNGPVPTAKDSVLLEFTCKLLDGTAVDSSVERGGPKWVPLTSLTLGWAQLVPRISTGTRVQAFVPPPLAYGVAGLPKKVPPYAVIVCDIELLEVQIGPAPVSPAPGSSPAPNR